MGLLPNTQNCGLRMRRECRERFPRIEFKRKPVVSDPGMHHGTCATDGIANLRWRGKRSRYSRRMRNPQLYVSGKMPILASFAILCGSTRMHHPRQIGQINQTTPEWNRFKDSPRCSISTTQQMLPYLWIPWKTFKYSEPSSRGHIIYLLFPSHAPARENIENNLTLIVRIHVKKRTPM